MTAVSRLTTARLMRLADELPDRYTGVLPHLERVRVLTGAQLDRLLTEPGTSQETTARVRRRIMTRLSGLGLVRMLDRRVGGARAGSAAHVYTLTSAGHTFLTLHRGQPAPGRIRHSSSPSTLFLNHALAVSEIYVQLTESSHTGRRFQVAKFRAPAWWPLGNSLYLRPDAYTVLATPMYRDVWWLEIDQATEPLPRVRDKCRDYLDHAMGGGTGPDGALPRVLLTTPTPKRCAAISNLISDITAGLPPPATDLFSVCKHASAAEHLITALHDQ